MKLFAIDSSAKTASAALTEDGRILGEFYIHTQLTHSETLMPMVEALFACTKVPMEEIGAFAVSAGPGSFTGVRIGVAAIKGLAMALQKPCVSVSTLEAMAYQHREENAVVCSLMDARCNQVYNALFRCENGEVKRLTEDRAMTIDELFSELEAFGRKPEETLLFVGDGAELCFSKLNSRIDARLSPQPLRFQRAVGVAFAAEQLVREGKLLDAAELMPVYLRLPQATRELKKRLETKKE